MKVQPRAWAGDSSGDQVAGWYWAKGGGGFGLFYLLFGGIRLSIRRMQYL